MESRARPRKAWALMLSLLWACSSSGAGGGPALAVGGGATGGDPATAGESSSGAVAGMPGVAGGSAVASAQSGSTSGGVPALGGAGGHGQEGGGAGNGNAPLEIPLVCSEPLAVSNSAELVVALDAAKAGSCIVLADGDYQFPEVQVQGTEAKPVVIRAENTLHATLATGNLALVGAAYVVVQGIHFTSPGSIRLGDCDHCRISRFRIERQQTNQEIDWVLVNGTSHDCRIDHNELGPQTHVGNMIMLAGSGAQTVQYTRIDHNYFHDIQFSGGNGWEIIRAGLSGWTFSSAHTTIEHNLFVRADSDPETISVKSSDNVIRYNTMRATAGEFTLRHGNRTSAYGNYILGDGVAGSGGFRIYGGDHKIYDNYIDGVSKPAILVDAGESDDVTGQLVDHKVAYGVQVVFNTIVGSTDIRVGSGKLLQPKGITVAYNVLQASQQAIDETAGSELLSIGNLVGAGSTNVFEGVLRADPKLVKVAEVFSIAADSPAVDAAATTFAFVIEDIEGKPRTNPDVGANEISPSPAKHGLLAQSDVGPLAP